MDEEKRLKMMCANGCNEEVGENAPRTNKGPICHKCHDELINNLRERKDIQTAMFEAQLAKNSCKFLTDTRGNVKSVETKTYHRDGVEAVKEAMKMQIEAFRRGKEEGFNIDKEAWKTDTKK